MIYLASDHAGFKLKEAVKKYLDAKKISYQDIGNHVLEPKDDYPDFAYKASKKIIKTKGRGIFFCGNGVGICMAANKVNGIRAVLAYNQYAARTSRTDDDTNVLCLAGRYLTNKQAIRIISVWLKTKFLKKDRYIRRLKKVQAIEKGKFTLK